MTMKWKQEWKNLWSCQAKQFCSAQPPVFSSGLPNACENPKARNERDSFLLLSALSICPWVIWVSMEIPLWWCHNILSQYGTDSWTGWGDLVWYLSSALKFIRSGDTLSWCYWPPAPIIPKQHSQWSRIMAALVQQYLEGHCSKALPQVYHTYSQSTTWGCLNIKMRCSIYVLLNFLEEGQRYK